MMILITILIALTFACSFFLALWIIKRENNKGIALLAEMDRDIAEMDRRLAELRQMQDSFIERLASPDRFGDGRDKDPMLH